MPKISVIIPTYNRSALVAEAIESVVGQNIQAHEIIVVDDDSTDDTQTVLSAYAARVPNLIIVSMPEHTPLVGRVRNAGVAASTGSMLAFLDSDDIWKPERIERQLANWESLPDAALAFCNLHTFGEGGLSPAGPYLRPDADYSGRIVKALVMEPLIVPSTMIVTREAFDRFGPFSDGVIEEDYEFILNVAAQCSISYLPEVQVLMRDHTGHRARQRSELPNLEYLRIIRRFVASHHDLTSSEKASARHGMANVHFKLARYYLQIGMASKAREHLLAMARLRPWDRRLPSAFVRLIFANPASYVQSSGG